MWIALQLASGTAFFYGSTVFIAMAGWLMFRKGNALLRVACLLGMVFVSASSTPLPYFFYPLWATGLLALIGANSFSNAKFRCLAALAVIVLSLVAAGMELPHLFAPGAVIDRHDAIFVIGDSITAGVRDHDRDPTWPTLLRNERGLHIIDLSQAGATLASALSQQRAIPQDQVDHSAVILEIGGNDLLGEVGAARFESDLDKLLMAVRPKALSIVMFELPLLPFHNSYGIAQRNLAKKYHIPLIPKRCFTNVIGASEATIDGLHLSASGQILMAELVLRVIGPGLNPSPSRSASTSSAPAK